MPIYPGTPRVYVEPSCAIKDDGFSEHKIHITSHIGTHIDFPSHMFEQGKTQSDYDISYFCGNALKIPAIKDKEIALNYLKDFEELLVITDFVLIRTGQSNYWNNEAYFSDAPMLTVDVVEYLLSFNIRGIGIDAISVDPVSSTDYLIHKTILGQNRIIIENLKNLDLLPEALFNFYCFPLKIENSDGAPVRAVASF